MYCLYAARHVTIRADHVLDQDLLYFQKPSDIPKKGYISELRDKMTVPDLHGEDNVSDLRSKKVISDHHDEMHVFELHGKIGGNIPRRAVSQQITIPSESKNTSVPSSSRVVFQSHYPQAVTSSVHYLCPVFEGRLGNALFQYASLYGIAAKKGMELIIGVDDRIYEIFKLRTRVQKNTYRCKLFQRKWERWLCAYDPQVLNFTADRNYRIFTYLQSWKYFEEVEDKIREEFIFRDRIKSRTEAIIQGIRQKYIHSIYDHVTLVGVHIRRGDIVGDGWRRKGYTTATKEYFIHAMDFFLSQNYTNVIFVICSNDMQWSKKSIPDNYTVEYMENNGPEIDLAILAACDHSIISVGTFSWWAGWLARGTVVYYRHFVKEGSRLRKQFSADFTDYIYPGWIGMD